MGQGLSSTVNIIHIQFKNETTQATSKHTISMKTKDNKSSNENINEIKVLNELLDEVNHREGLIPVKMSIIITDVEKRFCSSLCMLCPASTITILLEEVVVGPQPQIQSKIIILELFCP